MPSPSFRRKFLGLWAVAGTRGKALPRGDEGGVGLILLPISTEMIYYLLTKSEAITGKSRTEALMY